MQHQSFTTSILVDQAPEVVFNAINDPRKWWSEDIEGKTNELNAEFSYHYRDVHRSAMQVVELKPYEKVVWFVKDNFFNFVKDKTEWKGTKIAFEITKAGDQARLTFTHHGLVPDYECYNVCNDAWTNYIQGSLQSLIATGKGQPNPKEGRGFNAEIVDKWGLDEK